MNNDLQNLPKVLLIQVVLNSMKFIPQVFKAALEQDYPNFEFVAVIAGSNDGSKEYIQKNFPQVKVVDLGYNIGFAKGHNIIFEQNNFDYYQLVNPDLIMPKNFVSTMVNAALQDQSIAAVSGKTLLYDFVNNQPTNKIDSTGVTYFKSGAARDRGQHQEDRGQFDAQTNIIAVSGAATLYSNKALQSICYTNKDDRKEYFDEDLWLYFEDVDLSLRLINAGYKIIYEPKAVAYHGRAAGSSKGGYVRLWSYIRHHRNISQQIRELNYKNHIFLFIKNSPKWYWQFFVREFFYQIYVLFLETSTLKVLPKLFKQLPGILKKRKFIQQNRKISTQDFEKLMS